MIIFRNQKGFASKTLGKHCFKVFNGESSFDYCTEHLMYTDIFFPPMPPHVLMNFGGFPPGCGDSVADF